MEEIAVSGSRLPSAVRVYSSWLCGFAPQKFTGSRVLFCDYCWLLRLQVTLLFVVNQVFFKQGVCFPIRLTARSGLTVGMPPYNKALKFFVTSPDLIVGAGEPF